MQSQSQYMENQVRMPVQTEEKLAELATKTTMAEAIQTLMDLFENYYEQEIYKCVRYDQDTGEKLLFDWKPSNKFSRSIYLSPGTHGKIRFHSELEAFFRQEVMKMGKLFYFHYKDILYMIDNFTMIYSGQDIIAGIRIRPITHLPMEIGG